MTTKHPPADESSETSPESRDEAAALVDALGRPDAPQLVRQAARNEALLDKALASAHGVTQVRPVAPRQPRRVLASRGIGKYAWALAAAVLLAVGYMLRPTRPAVAPTALASSIIETRSGQKADTKLPDGTRVVLAPSSKLTVVGGFVEGPRRLILEGEAYFEVAHLAGRPFIVQAMGTTVEDIGTAFVVRAYATDRANAVAVRTGRVRVLEDSSARSAAVELKEGEAARVDRTSRAIERVPMDARASFAWLDGTLVFQRVTVREVLAELSRWYDLDLRVSDTTLLRQHLSFELRDNASVSDALTTVGALTSTKAERQGRLVTLKRVRP
jgi:transmembrane sensor